MLAWCLASFLLLDQAAVRGLVVRPGTLAPPRPALLRPAAPTMAWAQPVAARFPTRSGAHAMEMAFSFQKFKDPALVVVERVACMVSYIFAFVEISTSFAVKVFLNSDSRALKYFYVNYVAKLVNLYIQNVYLIFALMLAIFISASRGSLGGSKFARFNIIQAILLNIICSCVSAVFPLMPLGLRESAIGLLLANFLYLGTLILIAYSCVLIACGRYPKIPVLSEAARLQVQRGYSD